MGNSEELKKRFTTERMRKTKAINAQGQEKFILKLMDRSSVSKEAACDIINKFYDALLHTLTEVDNISLRNIGRFVVSKTRLNQKYATIRFHMSEAQRRHFTAIKEEYDSKRVNN